MYQPQEPVGQEPAPTPPANEAPPITVETLKDLPVSEREALWYTQILRQDTRQLTIRSAVIGMILGGVMSVSNLYVGLKTGWGFGVTITAGILAFAIFKMIDKIIPGKHFTDLENNAMQSVASAAGYMSSAGLVSAMPALLLLNGTRIPPLFLAAWIGAISLLGVLVAVPLKRQMINIDQLPFPSGIAAAETIKGLHGHGEEAMKKAKALAWGGLAGALVVWFKDAQLALTGKFLPNWKALHFGLPNELPWFTGTFRGLETHKLTLGFNVSLLLYAAGAIIGTRIGVSVLLGAVVNWVFIAPWLIEHQVVAGGHVIEGGFRQVAAWSTWPGTGMMVVTTLLAMALNWRSMASAFSGLATIFKPKAAAGAGTAAEQIAKKVEVPDTWFIGGIAVAGVACVALQMGVFHIALWVAALAVVLAIVLSMVTSRIGGETDIAPIGAMGKMTQLVYAAIAPAAPVTNLMVANVTAGSASHAADLLTDLKSGYILGANPRQQFLAQLLGVLAGTAVCVPVYNLLVPSADVLGTKFAAPAALVWKATAEALSKGISFIPTSALQVMAVTIAIGVVITLLEHFVPKLRKFLPSPTGFGLALVLPFGDAFAIFLGAVSVWAFTKWKPAAAERYVVPVASGVIAGESLIAVAIIALFMVLGLG